MKKAKKQSTLVKFIIGFLIGFVIIFLIVSRTSSSSQTQSCDDYNFNGIGQQMEINQCIDNFNINGQNNVITIDATSQITQININGINNVIRIPSAMQVPIQQNGIGNQIQRY